MGGHLPLRPLTRRQLRSEQPAFLFFEKSKVTRGGNERSWKHVCDSVRRSAPRRKFFASLVRSISFFFNDEFRWQIKTECCSAFTTNANRPSSLI
jgi:hypothetical protein